MKRAIQGCCWSILLAVAVSGLRLAAQDPPKDPQQQPAPVDPKGDVKAADPKENPLQNDPDIFWFNKDRSRPAAAAQLVGMGNPFQALALRWGGHAFVVWDEVGFGDGMAPELNPIWLRKVRDNRWPPSLIAKHVKEVPAADMAFYNLYTQAMLYAYHVPIDAFRRSALETGDVTWADLMETSDGRNERYRGQVIAIKGRLGQLRREKLIGAIVEKKGPQEGYIGWVFGPTRHANPYCIQFPHLPDGLKPGEKMSQPVTFYGYFLATIKYEGARKPDDSPRVLTTPMLVGPTVIVEPSPVALAAAPTVPVILVALAVAGGFIGFLTVLFFVMNFWMARNDRNVLDTLAMIKQKHAEYPFEENEAIQAKPENGKPLIAPVVSGPVDPLPPQMVAGPESAPEAKPISPPIALPVTPPIDPQRN